MGQPERGGLIRYLSIVGRFILGIVGGLAASYFRQNVGYAIIIILATCGLIAIVTWWKPILRSLQRPEHRVKIRAQEVQLDIGSGGKLNCITTKTEVENVGKDPVDRHAHSFRSVHADISTVAIQASDRTGKLNVQELYPSSAALRSFCVFFRHHLQPHDTYTYSWSASDIPNFFKEWWWNYSPTQMVDRFSLTVVHPRGYQIARVTMKHRPYDTILGDPKINHRGDRAEISIALNNVASGTYRLEWDYI